MGSKHFTPRSTQNKDQQEANPEHMRSNPIPLSERLKKAENIVGIDRSETPLSWSAGMVPSYQSNEGIYPPRYSDADDLTISIHWIGMDLHKAAGMSSAAFVELFVKEAESAALSIHNKLNGR